MALPMHYESAYEWTGSEMRGILKIEGVDDVPIGGGGDPGVLDPEVLILSAVESCHFNTFYTFAKNSGITIKAYRSSASGDLSFIEGQGYQFAKIVVRPVVTVAAAELDRAQRVMEKAHGSCLVSRSLKCPTEMEAEWITE